MFKINDINSTTELLVVTTPDCFFCKELLKNEKFNEMQIGMYLCFADYSATLKMLNTLIFKSNDPFKAFKKLLNNEVFFDDLEK